MTHICVGKLTIIGSDNSLSPGRRQAIIWTNAGILLIEPLGTNFSEILIGIRIFSFKKMRLKMSSTKWHPFSLGLNVLRCLSQVWAIKGFKGRQDGLEFRGDRLILSETGKWLRQAARKHGKSVKHSEGNCMWRTWEQKIVTLVYCYQNPVSISDKTSYCHEAAWFVLRIAWSLWNLTGTPKAVLPRYLPNFKAIIQTTNLTALRLHEFLW